MARPTSTQLTDAEHRIMAVLWERDEASVREITDALAAEHGLAYTTVLTTVRIMLDKGYVGFRKVGRAHIYHPLITRQGARRKALGSLMQSLFDGSPKRLAQHLIDDEQLTLEDIEALRAEVSRRMGVPAQIAVEEIRKPELDAYLVAESVASQLERRIMFRRAMRRAVTNAMRLGAEGIKVKVSGRLNGAEIARSEWYREGRVPLHTLRADIDYGFAEARTTYGTIGVKVWIFKGEVFETAPVEEKAEPEQAAAS